MATELGTYYVSLVPTARNIGGQMRSIMSPAIGVSASVGSESGGRFSQAFQSGVSAVGKAVAATLAIGAAAGTAAIVSMGRTGLQTAAQLETTNIAFTTMLGSAEKASGFMADMRQFAKTTPFDLPGLSKAASSLISIGVQQDKIIPIMTTLGNVTSGMGTGSEGIKRATVALQQMNAAGRISAEDLNQLRDAGIPVFELLTAATGKTTEEIAAMRDKGELGRNELNLLMDALETGRGFERFNGLMEVQSQSLSGLWETLKDTWSVGLADAIAPALPALKEGMSWLIGYIESDAMPAIQAAISGGINFAMGLDYTNGLSGFFDSLGVSLGPLTPAFDSMRDSAQTLWPALQKLLGALGDAAPKLFAGSINLLAGALGFLADHVDTIIAWMPAIVAGFIAWRIAAMGVNYVTAASVPIMAAANVARFMAARAELQVALAHRANQVAALGSTAATSTGIIANTRAAVAARAHQVAALAQAGAGRVAAAAQWLWNASLMGFPLVWLIVAIGAVVAGVIWFATQTEWGRSLVAGAWAGIQGAIQGVVDFWNGVLVPAAQVVFGAVGAAAMWLWTTFISPVFGWISARVGEFFVWFNTILVPAWNLGMGMIGTALSWLYTTFILPVFTAIGAFIGFVWNSIVMPIFNTWVWIFQNLVGPAIMWFWNSVVQPAFFLMGQSIQFFWNVASFIFRAWWAILTNVVAPAVMWFWNNVIVPAFTGIADFIGWVWNTFIAVVFWAITGFINNILGPAFDNLYHGWIEPAWNGIAMVIGAIWNGVVMPIWNGMIGFINDNLIPPFNALLGVAQLVWAGIGIVIESTWNWVKGTFLDPMVTFFQETIPNAFQTAKDNVGRIWDGIKGVVKEPIKWVINSVINDGIIGTFNTVADFLKIDGIPKVKLPEGWREGGHTGPGAKWEPKGPVHANEFVLRSEATNKLMSKYGLHGLNYMNKTGELPKEDNFRPPSNEVPAGPGTQIFGSLRSYNGATAKDIYQTRILNLVPQGASGYDVPEIARRWNGIAGVEVTTDRPDVLSSVGFKGEPSLWGGRAWGLFHISDDYGLIEVATAIPGASKNPVGTHEVGHALGLPHAHDGNNAHSIMNYNSQNLTHPTLADKDALRAIYPGDPRGGNGGSGGEGGGFNPFDFLFAILGDGLKKVFPAGGQQIDMALGYGRKFIGDVSTKALEMIGGVWDFLSGGDSDIKTNGNGRVGEWAAEALRKTGDFNTTNQNALVRRIMQESSGNPKAVNMWDSNKALGGTHGLMQLLHSNFAKYRDRGLSEDIYNGMANVVAGINYTKGRYPGRSMSDVWGQKGGYRHGGYVFDNGGWLMPGMAGINLSSSPEPVFSSAQWDLLSRDDDGDGRGDIYVQNPFTGDYLIAEVEEHAVDATGEVMQGSLRRSRRGGKYAGMRR